MIAELVMLAEKRRTSLNLTRVVTTLQANPNFRVTSLSSEIVLHTQTLTALRDIHDRLIVAEAQVAGAALITRDQAITASGLVKTVW